MSPKLQSTMSGPNKPLPPPPLPGNEPEPVMNSTIKLNRIISPIAIADLHKLFSGAPQFFARSEGHGTGAPHPSVAFPWNTELDIRDLCDHVAIQDEAWNAITTWPHVTRRSKGNAEIGSDHENIKAHFSFPYRERPSMLSMQGLERGTMGYQAALELGIADVLRHPDELQEEGAQHNLSERRRRLLNAKDGIRRVTESVLIDRLTNISKAYHEDAAVKHKRPTVELYSELFTQILFPPSRVTDTEDPYSLQVQIEALTDVLVKPVIWFDFSLVEWRIRLGQILWGPSFESDPEDEIVVNDEIANYSGAQKYWLLIQVLLSCELLMRLDAVAANIENRVDEPKPAELKRLEKKATPSLKWSLILGRHWLENIQVSITKSEATTEKKANSWLSSLTRSVAPTDDDIDEIFHNVNFEGRHPQRQLSGLLHFARKLDWPNIDSLSAKLTSTGLAISDSNTLSIAPAVSTPQSVATQQTSSYFGNRPSMPKGLSKQSMSAIIYPSGWLSNSYISGLILPGEALCHFLISTLLESDGTALAQLGDQVNLYGGFSYGGKSFWSTSCIVGRVLAARRGTSECVGWVSSDVVPRGSREAWVNVDVDINFQSRLPSDKDSDARIWDKAAIERHGNVIGGADYSSVLPGDFIIPPDKSPEFSVSVKFEALELIVVTDPYQSTSSVETPTPLTGLSEPLEIRTYSAIMQFSVDRDGMENRKINIPLAKDVHFVTAFPCVASPHTGILKPPINPSVQVSGRGTSPTETLKGTFKINCIRFCYHPRVSSNKVQATPSIKPSHLHKYPSGHSWKSPPIYP
jgi:hypothetical protein